MLGDIVRELANSQKTQRVFESALQIILGFGFQVVGIGFWSFWLRLPGPKPLD